MTLCRRARVECSNTIWHCLGELHNTLMLMGAAGPISTLCA
jgi:hypothetical protein